MKEVEVFKFIAERAAVLKEYDYVRFQLDNQNNIIGFTFTNTLPKANEKNFIYVSREQFQTKEANEILQDINNLIGL